MELIAAQKHEIDVIMELMEQAKAFLKSRGVDQWQDGYPDQGCIEKDIEAGKGFLCADQGNTVGYVCVDFGGEPAYDEIDGAWLSWGPYAAVHRLALDGRARGKGLASQILQYIEGICRDREVHSIKVDTDAENLIMRRLLEKSEFQYCGTVFFQNSGKVAYEKLI